VSNPVDDDTDDDTFPSEPDDFPAVDERNRKREVVTVQAAAAEFMADLTGVLPALDDVEAWERRDRAIAERQAAEDRRRAGLELERRAMYLQRAEIGWPARLVDDAIAADEDRPLMTRVRMFGKPPRDRGARHVLVLEGGVGVGKSTAATRWALDYGGSAPVYLRSATYEGEGRYDRELRARIRGASSIVLDDLGAEFKDGRGNFVAALDELVDVIYSQRLPAIITTNLRAEALRARYGDEAARFWSRLRGCARWASVSSGDLRGLQ
jgi:hypothetical protein